MIIIKLAVLLLDVQKRRTIKVEKNKNAKEMRTKKITKKKKRSHATMLKKNQMKNIMIMRMNFSMFQLKINLMKMRQLHFYLM